MKCSVTQSHYPLIKYSIPKLQVSVASILERADRNCIILTERSSGQLKPSDKLFLVQGQIVNILGFVAITQFYHYSAKQP